MPSMLRTLLLSLPAVLLLVTSPLRGAGVTGDVLEGYDALLQAHVDDAGYVDYRGLSEQRGPLDAFVASLAEVDRTALNPQQDLALLINAYNAMTLQLVLDHGAADGSLVTIKDAAGGDPWDGPTWDVGGEALTLNQLEHSVMRETYQEPRLHWAVVCAAVSCPPLRAEAYTGAALEQQLADQESRVFSGRDERFLKRAPTGGWLVTQILKWYAKDFNDGDWKGYALQRMPKPKLITAMLDYNWRLNTQANRQGR